MTAPATRRRLRTGPVLALSAALAAGTLVVGAGTTHAPHESGTASPAVGATTIHAVPVAARTQVVSVNETSAPDRKKRASRTNVRASASPFKFATTKFNRWYAKRYMHVRYDWKRAQFRCLAPLWGKESAWNERAHNSSSGAHGIPQAMPGSKMASVGKNWRSNPMTQIKWGLSYIKAVYKSPCRAWSHWKSRHWY